MKKIISPISSSRDGFFVVFQKVRRGPRSNIVFFILFQILRTCKIGHETPKWRFVLLRDLATVRFSLLSSWKKRLGNNCDSSTKLVWFTGQFVIVFFTKQRQGILPKGRGNFLKSKPGRSHSHYDSRLGSFDPAVVHPRERIQWTKENQNKTTVTSLRRWRSIPRSLSVADSI